MGYAAWIKLEHTTPTKHEIMLIADRLGIDPDEAFGKVVRMWIWADQNTTNGKSAKTSKTMIDRIAGKPGFADAMIEAGWLAVDDNTAAFPNFAVHNSATAKKRAESRKRKEESRTNVTEMSQEVVTPSSSMSSSEKDEGAGEGKGEDANGMARAFWFSIPGMTRPTLDELAPIFRAKLDWLEAQGRNESEHIWACIRDPTRDKSEITSVRQMFIFWKFCEDKANGREFSGTGKRQANKATARNSNDGKLSGMSAGGGRYEGIKPRIVKDDD